MNPRGQTGQRNAWRAKETEATFHALYANTLTTVKMVTHVLNIPAYLILLLIMTLAPKDV